jgi:hypothetical protein
MCAYREQSVRTWIISNNWQQVKMQEKNVTGK